MLINKVGGKIGGNIYKGAEIVAVPKSQAVKNLVDMVVQQIDGYQAKLFHYVKVTGRVDQNGLQAFTKKHNLRVAPSDLSVTLDRTIPGRYNTKLSAQLDNENLLVSVKTGKKQANVIYSIPASGAAEKYANLSSPNLDNKVGHYLNLLAR